MLLFPNMNLSNISFIWYDYSNLFIRPVHTIEKSMRQAIEGDTIYP